ncbi:serine hydroxymethyltransferase GlyA [Peptoclostridium acidaminophilum DSM 3953]|uniref:2-methylserine hydroxymethyltransferase n=1 Tax=Peptoclostridium acidaminophilum DSM 3953 TaxID=1286171 RepID=W8TM88_PEPAC|nr:serine hydroxymethyltransferase [Peptoclostridium acidaminophilum]AHM57322.1 serine hydroxymethyltransferase GlyA [Peptoclostridium acidaminophilum DSM 3953]
MLNSLKEKDQALYDIVGEELARQRNGIELIASESYVSEAIMELQGSVLTNKTAEGYPGKRYHAGCHVVDKMETLGIERAKELFGAEHANIQAHSGSQANQAVYAAMLNPGDTILGMRLDQGGHLTHGSSVNFSGKMYDCVSYGLNRETEIIDYDEVEKLAKEKRPKLLIAGASAYPRLIDYERMSLIAKEVGAYFMVDMAHIAGLVAAGVIPSPVPHADFVTSTTTKTLAGARGGFILCRGEHAAKVDKGIFPGVQGSMHFHIMAAKAHTFKNAMTSEYRECMQQVVRNAQKLAQTLSQRGFRIVTGGTDNHLMLVDVRPKGLTGVQLDEALESVGITVNKNMIPFDLQKPAVTSGIRIGTTAMTIKGMKEEEAEHIGALIDEVASNIDNKAALEGIAKRVVELGSSFPLYQGYFE